MGFVIASFVLLIVIFIGAVLEKSWMNPLTLFCGFWLTICVLAELKLYGMLAYSDNVFFIILFGIIGTAVGYVFAAKTRIHQKIRIPFFSIGDDNTYHIAEKVAYVFMGITLAIYGFMSLQVLGLLISGFDTATIREMYRDSGTTAVSGMASTVIFGSTVVKQLEMLIAQPVMRASIPLFAIELTKKGKLTKLAIMSLAVVLLHTFSQFGRFGLIYLIFDVLLCYFILEKKIDPKLKKRIRRAVLAGLAVIVFALIYLSIYRWENERFSFLQSIYAYFAIPVPLLDYWSDHASRADAYSFGTSFIMGFMFFVIPFLKRLGISLPAYEIAVLYNYNLVDQFIPIFSNQHYNAYVSMFFAFYLDFREIGVFLGCFLWGYILAKSYKMAKTKRTEYICFYLLLMQCLIKSFVRWEFVLGQYFLSFFILRIWIHTDKKKIDKPTGV